MIFSCDFRNVLRLNECVQSASLTRCPPSLAASSPPEMASLHRWCEWTDCIVTLMAGIFSVAEETFLYYWGPSGDQYILPQRFLLMHELCHDSSMMHIWVKWFTCCDFSICFSSLDCGVSSKSCLILYFAFLCQHQTLPPHPLPTSLQGWHHRAQSSKVGTALLSAGNAFSCP